MRTGPQAGAGGPEGALEPAEAMRTLAALHAALNEHDPHFAYDYSVDTACPVFADQPGLVAAVQEGDGKRWVTIKVLARCAESLAERPVPLSIWITVDPGSDLQRDIEAFDKYGTPFTAPAGTTDAEIALPGGLGGTVTGGSVRIEAPAGPPEAEYDIRLQITDPSGEVIVETLMHMQPPTTGPSGTGKRGYGAEQHGAFSFEMLADFEAQTVGYTVHLGDLAGKPPGLVLPGVRLVREFRHPNGLRFAAPYGPVTHRSDPLPEGAESIEGIGVIADLIEGPDLRGTLGPGPVLVSSRDLPAPGSQGEADGAADKSGADDGSPARPGRLSRGGHREGLAPLRDRRGGDPLGDASSSDASAPGCTGEWRRPRRSRVRTARGHHRGRAHGRRSPEKLRRRPPLP